MATLEKTIDIIFGAQDRNVKSTIRDIETSFSTFDAGIQNAAQPTAELVENILKIEAAIAAAGAALVGFAINEAGTFKESVNGIAALFNGTAEQSAVLGNNILEFSRTSVNSIDDLNRATFTAISNGTEWTKVTEALAVAEQLAVAGSTNLETATAVLSRTMNAYGIDATEAQRVSEALFVAAQQGDTNLTGLANAFGRLAPTAAAAGVELDDALAAVAAITVAGVKTDEAMTLLNSLFKELASPTKELAAALGGMNLETNSLQEIMQVLRDRTGGTFANMDQLFSSTEAVRGALILSNDSAGKFSGALDAMANKTGTVAAAFDLMEKDFSKINQNIVNNIRATLIGVGDDLLDEYGSIGGALSSIFKSIGDSFDNGSLSEINAALESFLADLAQTLNGIATALPEALENVDFSGLLQSFSALADEFGDIFNRILGQDLDLTRPEDLAAGIQTIVNIMTSFVNITKSIIDQFDPIFDLIGEAGQQISGVSDETAESTGKLLGSLTILGEFGTSLGSIILIIKETQTDIANVFDILVGAAKIFSNSFQVAFDTVALSIVSVLQKITDYIATFGEGLGLDQLARPFREQSDELKIIGDSIQQNLNRNASELTNGWEQMADGLTGGTKRATDAIETLGGSAEKPKAAIQDLTVDTDALAQSFEQFGLKLDPVTGAVTKLGNASGRTDEEIQGIIDAAYGAGAAVSDLGAAVEGNNNVFDANGKLISTTGFALDEVGKTMADTAQKTDKLTESQRLAIEQTNKLELQLNELASNERIKSMEFTANIRIADIQAQAQQVVAAFDSIGQAIQATQEASASIFGDLADAFESGLRGGDLKFLIDFAEEQQRQAQQALDDQSRLIDAQIRQMDARTAALLSGQGLITINADQLAPELQQVLRSLVENIQIQANAEGLELLL